MNLKTYPALCLVTTLRKNLPRAQRKMTRITMYAYIFYILFILITSYNIYFNFLTNTRCACAHALTLKHIKSYSSLYIIEIKILIFQTQMILFCYHEALCTCFEQHDSKKVQYCVERVAWFCAPCANLCDKLAQAGYGSRDPCVLMRYYACRALPLRGPNVELGSMHHMAMHYIQTLPLLHP